MQRIGVTATLGLVCLLMTGVRAASAQEQGNVGITMGYPGILGLMWHVTDRLAIRPEFDFDIHRTNDDTFSVSADTDTTVVGFGVSALFYLREWDKLRTFISPRYAYMHASTTSDLGGTVADLETHSTFHGISGSFGAQYSLSDKFSLYGEVGLEYTNSTSTASGRSGRSTSNGVGTQTGVGVIFYF